MTSHSSESVRSSAVIPEETHARIGALVAANDVPVAWVIPHTVPTFLKSMATKPDARAALPRLAGRQWVTGRQPANRAFSGGQAPERAR